MATKEEIEKRVQDEAQSADDRYTKHKGDVVRSFQAAVRPLVERVIELEEEGAKYTALTVKLAQAEQRVIEQGRTIEVLNADRSRILADLTEARADLRTAQRELDEERAAHSDVLRGRTMAENKIVELREALRLDSRQAAEDARTSDALRAQVTALQAVIDGHEQAIRDACADVRADYESKLSDARAALARADKRHDRLETTVDVLAWRLADRCGG